MPYSVDINEIYNVSERESLKLLNITVYNESFSYSFYVLVYNARHNQYNLSVVTRIIPLNDTNLFMTMVNIDPRDDKAQPVADIVFFTNKTNLADHYRLIGKVLNEIRNNDETKWIWNKVKIELNDLARKVERDLAEYNVEGAGFSTVVDGFLDCLYDCAGRLMGILGCAATCASCPESGWSCLLCAVCLCNAGCCVGKCASEEPWGIAFCASMKVQCILGNQGACLINLGCEGHCPL